MTAVLELDGRLFAGGRSRFHDSHSGDEPTPKIFLKILPGELSTPLLAQLDTGAAWSMLNAEVVDALGLFHQPGADVRLSTRTGVFRRRLMRAPLTLLADEGESFEVESTLFTCRDWAYGSFLGYPGLLERIRFAVDPSTNDFYFGGLSEIEGR